MAAIAGEPELTSSVLLNVELPQKCDCLVSAPSALGFKARFDVATVSPTIGVLSRHALGDLEVCISVSIDRGVAVNLSVAGHGSRLQRRPRHVIRGRQAWRRRGRSQGYHLTSVHVDAEDTASTAELVVDSAEKDLPYPELSKKGRAHNTGFDRDVENAIGDDGGVDAGRRVKLLAVRVEMAVLGVDIAPYLFGWGWRGIVGLVRVRTSLSSFTPSRFRSWGIRSRFVRLGRVREKRADGHELSMSCAVPGDVGGVHALRDDLSIVNKNTANRRLVGHQG